MNRSPLWEGLSLFQKKSGDEILEKLKAVPVFESIPDRGLRIIREMCHVRHYKEDEHVFRSGEPGVGMYILLEGQVEIYRHEKDFRRQLAVLNEGDFFGEIALLDDSPRSASARALKYSRLLGFFRPDLHSILSRKTRLASTILLNMASLVGRRLISNNEALENVNLSVKDLEGQVESLEQKLIASRKQIAELEAQIAKPAAEERP